jgi:hypothetical protein
MARSFAPEGAPLNILCNVVMPTARTRMTERMPSSDYAEWLWSTMAPAKVAVGAAYLLSDECAVSGEMFSVGGGRIARIRLAETPGVLSSGSSLEEMRDVFATVMMEEDHIFPKDQQERVSIVHPNMGFPGVLRDDAYAVKDIG